MSKRKNFKHSEESKKKISESLKGMFAGDKHPMKGKHHSNETRKKISESNTGKKHTEETKRRLSEIKKGKPRPDLVGKEFSEETRKKISEKLTGREFSEEHKKNLSKSMKGRPSSRKGKTLSEESKMKISKANKGNPSPMKGKKHSEEAKQKLSESKKGKKLSVEHRLKIKHAHSKPETKRKNSEAHKGKKHTEESKRKMSISQNKPETLQKNRERRSKQIFPSKDTKPEKILEELCKNAGIRFTKHKNFDLGFQGHQVDVFIEPNICLEADGDRTHANPHSYLIPSRTSTIQPGFQSEQIIFPGRTAKSIREKDRKITEGLIQQGNHVLRFWHSELEQNPEECIQKIMKTIKNQ